jgi:hypothetical protein
LQLILSLLRDSSGARVAAPSPPLMEVRKAW